MGGPVITVSPGLELPFQFRDLKITKAELILNLSRGKLTWHQPDRPGGMDEEINKILGKTSTVRF